MRDPHVHVERGVVMLTHAQMREAFTKVTGLAVDAPKTVTTGCGRHHPYVLTSTRPAAVTCLACRDYAAAQHDRPGRMRRGRRKSLVINLMVILAGIRPRLAGLPII